MLFDDLFKFGSSLFQAIMKFKKKPYVTHMYVQIYCWSTYIYLLLLYNIKQQSKPVYTSLFHLTNPTLGSSLTFFDFYILSETTL